MMFLTFVKKEKFAMSQKLCPYSPKDFLEIYLKFFPHFHEIKKSNKIFVMNTFSCCQSFIDDFTYMSV